MELVEEIEAAIERLAPEDFQRFAIWFREREAARWDRQLDEDSASGRLDFLFEEDTELRSWPSSR